MQKYCNLHLNLQQVLIMMPLPLTEQEGFGIMKSLTNIMLSFKEEFEC